MKNVLLVFGGKSYEHDISVVTAMQIYKKARLKDINLVLFYVSRQDEFFVCDSKKAKLVDFSLKNFNKKNKAFKGVCFVSNEKKKLFLKTRFGLKEFLTCDSAIIACHGGDGENGRLVTFLEKQGIVCSAGNSKALSFCMDKFMFKSLMRGLKLPIVSGFCISKDDYLNDKIKLEDYFKFYKFPLVIKANSGGSSIGVFIVEDIDDFNDKIKPELAEALGTNDIQGQKIKGTNQLVIKTPYISDTAKRAAMKDALAEFGAIEDSYEESNISASVGKEMKQDAIVAVILATICMLIYIWFRFTHFPFRYCFITYF